MSETIQPEPEMNNENPKQIADLTELQEEISRLQRAGDSDEMPEIYHNLDPTCLTEEDLEAYNDYLAGKWDQNKFYQYRERLQKALERDSQNERLRHRRSFIEYLGNRWQNKVTAMEFQALRGTRGRKNENPS